MYHDNPGWTLVSGQKTKRVHITTMMPSQEAQSRFIHRSITQNYSELQVFLMVLLLFRYTQGDGRLYLFRLIMSECGTFE